MIFVNVPVSQVCWVEPCSGAVLARYRALSPRSLQMKASHGDPVLPPHRQAVAPNNGPTGGGSGGGAILGGEGAPGAGTGVPGTIGGSSPI